MAFNPELFLQTEINTPLSTEYALVPEGEWLAQIVDVNVKQNQRKSDGQVFTGFEAQCEVVDEDCKQVMEIDRNPRVRYDFILDVDESTGQLSVNKGDNVKLGRLFEACGMNEGARTMAMIKGNMIRLKVGHQTGEDKITRARGLDAAAA